MNHQIKFVYLLAVLILSVSAQNCHHSCAYCYDQDYTHCYNCSDTTNTFNSIGNANSTAIGLCSSPALTSVNALGIVLVLAIMGIGLFLRSPHLFYFMLSLQVLGLVSLIEIAFPSSLTTLLDSFQYLMIFSKMQQNSKTNDYILITHNLYRLQAFLTSVTLDSNFIPIFVLTFIVTVFLILFLLFKKFRNGKCMCISEHHLDTILSAFRTFILLTMQQALLIIYTGIRFDTSLQVRQIAMIVIYCLILIFFLVDINYHRLPYFKSKKLLNLTIAQRLVLPVLAIIPHNYTYQMIIFVNALALLELIFYTKSGAKTKHYVYSTIRFGLCVLLATFVGVDLSINKTNSSNIAAIIASIGIVIFLVAFVMECLSSIKQTCCDSKVSNKGNKGQTLIRSKTNDNIFRQDTLGDLGNEANTANDSHKAVPDEPSQPSQPRGQEKTMPNMLQNAKKPQKKFRPNKK